MRVQGGRPPCRIPKAEPLVGSGAKPRAGPGGSPGGRSGRQVRAAARGAGPGGSPGAGPGGIPGKKEMGKCLNLSGRKYARGSRSAV